jgi:hypothetical protein
MNQFAKSALLVLAIAGTPAVMSGPALAAVDFSISVGNVAFGFADGYWDRDHHWRSWRNREEARYFRTRYPEHYNDYRHDRDRRDRRQGWREERWWAEHR